MADLVAWITEGMPSPRACWTGRALKFSRSGGQYDVLTGFRSYSFVWNALALAERKGKFYLR
jgi:hypothetical protein